jgi:hypothetical protein
MPPPCRTFQLPRRGGLKEFVSQMPGPRLHMHVSIEAVVPVRRDIGRLTDVVEQFSALLNFACLCQARPA